MTEATPQFEHKWAFVIIPVEGLTYPEDTIHNATEALLAAYCKHCDTYYTNTLCWSPMASKEAKAGVPRFGCLGPEGRF